MEQEGIKLLAKFLSDQHHKLLKVIWVAQGVSIIIIILGIIFALLLLEVI